MSIQTPSENNSSEIKHQSDEELTKAADAIGNLWSHVAAPVLKNTIKAFNQLCSSAVKIPITYLEGIESEIRAASEARVNIISASGKQIEEQIQVDPEFAKVAIQKYGSKIIREQINLDKVCKVAATQLQEQAMLPSNNSQTAKEIPPIDDDWLNSFEKEASQKSTEEMQLLFGRILASEINQPSSFSIKTVKLIGQLDSRTANLFRLLCSLSISLRLSDNNIIDARVLSLGGNAASNSLQNYGLNFDQLNVLQEYGLIISDFNSYMDYSMCVAIGKTVALPLKYQNRDWALVPSAERTIGQELRLDGVALSRSGKELLKIVDIETNDLFTDAIKDFFQKRNLSMVEITNK
jgi:hypothetical protein